MNFMNVKFLESNGERICEILDSEGNKLWSRWTNVKVGLPSDVFENDQEHTISTTIPTNFDTSTTYAKVFEEEGQIFYDSTGEVDVTDYLRDSIVVKFKPYDFGSITVYDNGTYKGICNVYFRPNGVNNYTPIKEYGISGTLVTKNQSVFFCRAPKYTGAAGSYHVGDIKLIANEFGTTYTIYCKVLIWEDKFQVRAYAATPTRTNSWTVKFFKLSIAEDMLEIDYDGIPRSEKPEPEPPTPVVKEVNFKRYLYKMPKVTGSIERVMFMGSGPNATTGILSITASRTDQTPAVGWFLTPIYADELDKFKAYIDGTLTEAYTFGDTIRHGSTDNDRFILYNPERNCVYAHTNNNGASSSSGTTTITTQYLDTKYTRPNIGRIALFNANYNSAPLSTFYLFNLTDGTTSRLNYESAWGCQAKTSTGNTSMYIVNTAYASSSDYVAQKADKAPEYYDTYLAKTL